MNLLVYLVVPELHHVHSTKPVSLLQMHPVVAEKEVFKIDLEIINLHVSYELQRKLKYKNKKQNDG